MSVIVTFSQNFVSLDQLINAIEDHLKSLTVNKDILPHVGIHIGSGYHDFLRVLRKLHPLVCS